MEAPICLVENINEVMTVNKEAIEILEKISQPVVVVAIVGLYRTGKSYLMNRLAGRNCGFQLGSTIQSKTKGIWMWCMPHPINPDHTLVLLDTEGLGDVEKGDPKNDSWIFALAILLSSTFVYNSMGTINHQALEQLHYVTELTELIKAKSSSNSDGVQDCTEFVSFFPDFIWAVRDFNLQLQCNDNFITADQYLEKALKLISGLGALVESYVKAINSGAVPCLENTVITLAQRWNAAAVEKAAAHYSEQMAQRLQLPTDTLQELLDVHAACEKKAIAVFMENSFKDEDGKFQKKLVETIEKEKQDFLLKNEEESHQYCQKELTLLSKALMESISAGRFCAPGGHKRYMEMRKKIEEDYCQVPRKGVKAREVLQKFLHSQAATEDSILQSDKELTKRDRAIAAGKAKKEAAEMEQKISAARIQEEKQKQEALQRTHRENMEQLEKKLISERENLLKEQKMMLEQQMKIQMEYLKEGFKKKSEEMNDVVKSMNNQLQAVERDNNSFITGALNSVGEGIATVLGAPGKLWECS
ncbi:guanylate-binding protein 6-like isoform X3 [Octodon degus]|uniref:Guanylate-binding protein 6-like isoform X3 n=1 Tax=Octodon degus TaxID=10160 RepID=A0A6P6EUZ2_OCTDE|nr:guanylate-binding protein 6-like isoform X3 [Octodon degus]